jgi:hypothetical protein
VTKRVVGTAMRVAGNGEGDGEGGKGNGNGDKGVGQGMALATKRAMATATRVAGNKVGDGDKEGNGDRDEGSRQQKRQWQGHQGRFSIGHIICAHSRANI